MWLRAGLNSTKPMWGFVDGIQVGIWPASIEDNGEGGPRGLLRIGYPIKADGKALGLVNYIAIEPVVDVKNFAMTGRYGGCLSLAPDDSPLLLHDTGTQDVYSVDWQAP